jgi:hypothetical protein
MVIVNGTITAKVKSGGGLGADGYPVEPSESWQQPLPCRIVTNKKNDLGKQNGNTFTIASYEVFIEARSFQAGRVKLTEYGRDLGEFSVLWAEYLDAVGLTKIVV